MRRVAGVSPLVAGLAVAVVGLIRSLAPAAEALLNGDLEESVSPSGWTLTTSITGSGEPIPSLFEHNDGANQPTVMPGQLGLFIKPQAGNQSIYAGENNRTNLTLEQAVTGIAGRTYTFSGHTFWGGDGDGGTNDGYSGGVDLLHSASPSDPTPENPDDPSTVESPTESMFEIAFLNSSNAEIGSPTFLDLRTVQTNNATWLQHTMPGAVAPAGTAKVRVRVLLTDMVDNFGYQDVFLDNFSLRDSVVPGLERLTNAGLNTPGDPLGWTQMEGPDAQGGTADSLAFINFANHTSGGQQGMWVRPFVNTTQFEPDIPTVFATLSQTVPGVAGEDYTFSAWTAWETGYAGSIEGSGVQTLLKMEFLDSAGDPIAGETVTLDLYAAGMRADADGGNIEPEDWAQWSTPTTTAPAGTVSVRVSVEGLDMFNSFINPQSAFFDDFSLITTAEPGVPGDFNEDGKVDAADYAKWRANDGPNNPLPNDNGVATQADRYTLWVNNFGSMAGAGSGSALGAVPEPSSLLLLAWAALGMIAAGRRQGR